MNAYEQGEKISALSSSIYERGNIFRHPFRICPYRTNTFKTVQSTGNLYLWIGVVFMGNLSVKGKFQGVSTLEPTRGWLLPRGWIIQAAQWPLGLWIPLRKTHPRTSRTFNSSRKHFAILLYSSKYRLHLIVFSSILLVS